MALGAATTTVEAAVSGLQLDHGVDGILVQQPTPVYEHGRPLFEAIGPAKDVDGVTLSSFASMASHVDGDVHPRSEGGTVRASCSDHAKWHSLLVAESQMCICEIAPEVPIRSLGEEIAFVSAH